MKRIKSAGIGIVLAVVMAGSFALAGCSEGQCTIQYSDDDGLHTLTVQKGQLYSLETIPYRYGYEFLGLYDAKTDGEQCVDENGVSVSKAKKDMTLYPRFQPIEFTVILDYGEAAVTGARSFQVRYNEALPELPTGLTLAHSEFTGWYTEKDGGGTQVADAYGLLPEATLLNEKYYSLDTDERRTYLYAGFDLETYPVTFHFDGYPDETVEVAYNTPVSQVVPATRNAEKQAVLLWSTEANDTEKAHLFSGKITGEMELYAAEWAPVIEFDGDGAEVSPLVARAGTDITLPTPEKPLATFMHWEDESGSVRNFTKMPQSSVSLKAVWQGKIEFDENGGTLVDDISEEAGSAIALPTPTREGYLFAGWYTAGKEPYTAKTMPAEGIALKAGWYRQKTKEIVILSADSDSYLIHWQYNIAVSEKNKEKGPDASRRITVDLSEIVPKSGATIFLSLHWKSYMSCKDTVSQAGFCFYDDAVISDANLVGMTMTSGITSAVKDCSYEGVLMLRSDRLYLCYVGKSGPDKPDGYAGDYLHFDDIYAEIGYPDTSRLYL